MSGLPSTSPGRYLTGFTALNVPTEDGDFADWHFNEVFLAGRGKFVVNGVNSPDTTPLLGDYGVRECSRVLRKHGVPVPVGQEVYAANYVRAVVDLVLKSTSRHRMPEHVRAEEYLDKEDDLNELSEVLSRLKLKITDPQQLALIERWEYF